MHFGGMFAYSMAFAVVRHSLKEPPQPGIIAGISGWDVFGYSSAWDKADQ